MPFGAAVAVGAGVAAAGSIAGGLISGAGAKAAGETQAQYDMQANQLLQQRYQDTANNLNPYISAGQQNLGALTDYYKTTTADLGDANAAAGAHIPGTMTQSQLLQTPGYQFNLDQGLKATQNAQTARGLGNSGAATKAAGSFATGLASNTYQQQFANQQSQYQDYSNQFTNTLGMNNAVFNQLYQPSALGQTAASNLGNIGANIGANQGLAVAGAGAALGAGIAGQANALAGGISQATGYGAQALGYYGTRPSTGNVDTKSTF